MPRLSENWHKRKADVTSNLVAVPRFAKQNILLDVFEVVTNKLDGTVTARVQFAPLDSHSEFVCSN